MEAENLVRFVLLDSFSTRIPGHDTSIAVEEIDCVVANSFHNRTELGVVAPQGLKRGTLLGYITHEAQDDGAGRRFHGLEHDVDGEFATILAQPEEVHGSAHLAGSGVSVVVFAMAGVAAPETGRDQILNGLADEIRLHVTE